MAPNYDVMSNQSNNKRIAKNTIMLYIRMVVITIVSFYTTRITLQILGVEDFGIRNVVSGIISFMGIITTAMVNAAQRFLSFDLGKNDHEQFRCTFSMLINIFLIISIIGTIIMELVGPFIISNYLTIPSGRLVAAQCIFQFTVISFIVSTVIIPFTSAVIALERMEVFAYVSLLEAFLKLGVVFLLYITSFDKLIAVVFLTLIASIVSNSIYVFYCRAKINGCKYIRKWDSNLLQKLLSFMGWNLFGSATSVMNVQGQAILLNIFFGPIINAAKAIADTVHGVVQSFISNFFMAVGPQIVKTYANDDKNYTLRIVIYSTKFAFFLVALIGLPVIFNMKPLLILWLGKGQVSDYMVLFAQWTIIQSIVQVFDYPITQTVRASGDIKKYQVVTGLLLLLFIPICYVAFRIGLPAISSMIILTLLIFGVLHYRISMLSRLLDMSYATYYTKVIIPSLLAILPSLAFSIIIPIQNEKFVGLFLSVLASFVVTFICVVVLGMNKSEREFALSFIKSRKR